MTFIFDFDHTLFDTHAFKRYLMRGGFIKYFTGFRKGELDRFVFPEAVALIETLARGNRLILVTAGTSFLQKRRVYSCSLIQHFDAVHFSNWKEKGPIIADIAKRASQPIVYIDNNPRHLASVEAHRTDVSIIRMRRPDGPYYGRQPNRFRSVRSLSALQHVLYQDFAIEFEK